MMGMHARLALRLELLLGMHPRLSPHIRLLLGLAVMRHPSKAVFCPMFFEFAVRGYEFWLVVAPAATCQEYN